MDLLSFLAPMGKGLINFLSMVSKIYCQRTPIIADHISIRFAVFFPDRRAFETLQDTSAFETLQMHLLKDLVIVSQERRYNCISKKSSQVQDLASADGVLRVDVGTREKEEADLVGTTMKVLI